MSLRQKEEVELPTEIGVFRGRRSFVFQERKTLEEKSTDSCFGCCQEVSEDPDQ